jgi:hypothetical protein
MLPFLTKREVHYWAVSVGDSGGARLDGKVPSELKDASGNALDARILREEAAARRMEVAAKAGLALATTAGKTVAGKMVAPATQEVIPVSKRKFRVGSKFSRLKQSGAAFQGNANR